MYKRINQPIQKQKELAVLTPLVSIKQEHVKMVRKVNIKSSWGGADILTLEPEEHKVLCECVALSLIKINDKGNFVVDSLAGGFLEEHSNQDEYYFFDSEKKAIITIDCNDILMMQTYMYSGSDGMHIHNQNEMDIMSKLEKIGYIKSRDIDGVVDFFVTQAGIDFMIREGFYLG